MILLLLFSRALFAASTYDCETIFGETLIIKKYVLQEKCDVCATYGAPIPGSVTTSFNPGAELWPQQKAQAKRRVFERNGSFIYLDTRYFTRSGPKFQFHLACSEYGKCTPSFEGGGPSLLLKPEQGFYDQRKSGDSGELTLQFTSRDHAGFLARISKISALPGKNVSSSGETKIYREDPEFSFDLGVDEQFELVPGEFNRLATLEAKVNCQRR